MTGASQTKVVAKPSDSLIFVARILCIGQQFDHDPSSAHILIADSLKRRVSITALNEAAGDLKGLRADDVVICRPDSFDGVGLKAICTKKGSLTKVKPERKDIPYAVSLETEIEGLESSTIVSVDAMSLSESSSREVQTKEGLVKRAEVSLGDPTGEIKAYAWRGLAKFLEKIPAGTRLKLYGVEVQSYEGKKFLVLKNYSRVSILE